MNVALHPELEHFGARANEWRAKRAYPRQRFPDELMATARALAKVHGSRAVELAGGIPRDRFEANPKHKAAVKAAALPKPAAKFVALSLPVSANSSEKIFCIELENKMGAKLRFSDMAEPSLRLVLSSFLGV